LTDQAKGYYNSGNVLYREGKWEEAIGAYKKALELNPNDEDAKYNLEFVRQKIKENLKPQKPEVQKKDQKKEPAKQKQPQAGQNPDSTGEKKPEQQPEQLAQEKKDGQKPQPRGQMSKEDAERLLQAVKEQPVQKRQGKRILGQRATDKDW
jgi:tetratricopeptide (TPR) repeat protein